MASLRLVYDDLASTTATLSAESTASGLPVTNLLSEPVAKVWRSATAGSAWIRADFAQTTTIDTVAVIGTNATGGAYKLSSTASHTGDVVASTPLAIDTSTGVAVAVMPLTTAARYLEVDLTASGDAYFQAGRLVAGAGWEPAFAFPPGHEEGWVEEIHERTSEGGVAYDIRKWLKRRASLTIQAITDIDRATHLRSMTLRGRSILACLNVDSANPAERTLWGRRTSPVIFTSSLPQRGDVPLEIEEHL